MAAITEAGLGNQRKPKTIYSIFKLLKEDLMKVQKNQTDHAKVYSPGHSKDQNMCVSKRP